MKDKITIEEVNAMWDRQFEAAERLDKLVHMEISTGHPQKGIEQARIDVIALTERAEVLQEAYFEQVNACPHVTTEWVEIGARFSSCGEADDDLEWRLICLDCGDDITPEKQVDDEIPF